MIKKTRMWHVRITEEEASTFKHFAERWDVSQAVLLRKIVREFINQTPEFLTDEQSLLFIAIRQLVGIAHNLNQVVTAIHSGNHHRPIDLHYLQEIKSFVLEVKQELAVHIERSRHRWVKHFELTKKNNE